MVLFLFYLFSFKLSHLLHCHLLLFDLLTSSVWESTLASVAGRGSCCCRSGDGSRVVAHTKGSAGQEAISSGQRGRVCFQRFIGESSGDSGSLEEDRIERRAVEPIASSASASSQTVGTVKISSSDLFDTQNVRRRSILFQKQSAYSMCSDVPVLLLVSQSKGD